MNNKITSFSGEHRFLSNFWPISVVFEDKVYPSTEHAYQASKTTDENLREQIRKMKTPGDAKNFGQQLEKRPDWNDAMRIAHMTILVEIKFSMRNLELAKKLLETKDAELIEGNTWGDTFFGVYNGIGENHLGRILMATREKLRITVRDIQDTLDACKWKRREAVQRLGIAERTLNMYIQVFKLG